MSSETSTETVEQAAEERRGFEINWRRVEGLIGAGALFTSFLWFLGMPTGMAIGVGVGTILLVDFSRALIFDSSQSEQPYVDARDTSRY